MTDLVFLVVSAVCVGSALAIVWQKNPVYSVVYMLPLFLGLTTIFVMLQAPFLAAIQMIVYGGAILVLFLFVIMLINMRPEELRDDFSFWPWALTTFGAAALFGVIYDFVHRGVPEMVVKQGVEGAPPGDLSTAFATPIPDIAATAIQKVPESFGSVGSIAHPLFNNFLVPFELTSLLIVVAMLGAVLLSKKRI